MRVFPVLVALLCSACVVAPPPVYAPPVYAPPPPVAVQQQPLDVQQPPVAGQQPAPPPAAAGQTCREFDTPVMIDGQEQQAHGSACLQPDGSWRVEQQAMAGQPTQTYVVAPQAYQPYYPPAYLADPWFYGPPLFVGGVFVGGGWGYRHGHGGWHGAWRGGWHR